MLFPSLIFKLNIHKEGDFLSLSYSYLETPESFLFLGNEMKSGKASNNLEGNERSLSFNFNEKRIEK